MTLGPGNYSTTCSTESDFLRFTSAGVFSVVATTQLFDVSVAEAERRGVRKVLLDVRDVGGCPRTIQRYVLGVHAASVYHGIRITLVGQPDALDHWGETVARYRGCDLRVFVDESEALAWLHGAGDSVTDDHYHYYLYVKRGDRWVPLDISTLNEAELREVLNDPNNYRVVNWIHR